MTPRALPRLARISFFTVHESGGICRQPPSVLPSKIFVMPGGSGALGAGTDAMFAIDCCVVGDVVGVAGAGCAAKAHADDATRTRTTVITRDATTPTIDARFMAAHYI